MEEIGEHMSSPVMRIDSESNVQDAAILMETNHIGSLIVEKFGDDVGIVTEKDLMKKVVAKGKNLEEVLVEDVMTKPILSMDRYLPIEEANLYMQKKKIRHLAITEEDKIVGILSISDLVAFYTQDFRMQE